MVYFKKSKTIPSSLIIEKNKKTGTYRTEEVIKQIDSDFYSKCYICEQKKPTTINVEHFIPHKDNIDLKFDWNNLFYACGHCNNIKLAKKEFDNILNCIILSDKVDEAIAYKFSPFPKEKPCFDVLIVSEKAENAKELLEKVFNGIHTELKTLESANLRDLLLKSIKEFQELLIDYYNNEDKEYFLIKVKEHLSNRSAFTAFKRYIIRNNNELNKEFKKYIID